MDLLAQATVRKAKPSDYTAVVDGIGDMFNGRDELPDKYMDFLEDEDVSAFVLELEGHGVVGFYAAQYIDDGKTLVKRAGRIHPDFRGLGLFRYLAGFLIKDGKDRGTVEREIMVALKPNAPRLEKLDYKMTHSLELYDKDIKPKDIPPIQPTEYENIHRMTSTDMELFFSNEEIWNKIVPSGFLWVESLKLRRHKMNTKRLINRRNSCYMSFEDGSGETKIQQGTMLTNTTINKLSMISTCHRFRAKTGLACNLDFFSDSFDHLLPHIKCHLAEMKTFEENKIHLQVSAHPHRQQYVQGKIEEIFRSFGISLERDPIMTTDFIFEKKF